MFNIIRIIVLFFFCAFDVSAFVSQTQYVQNLNRLKVIRRYQDNDVLSDVVVPDENTRLDSTWWQIFGDDSKLKAPLKEEEVASWLPSIGAWRNVFPAEVVVHNNSPPSLEEYLEGSKILGAEHEGNIQGLWSQMKNRRSLKQLSEINVARVKEALRVAYVSLWGKQTTRSLEVSINRARGTAAVLAELEADLDVVLAAILSDVLAELPSDEKSQELRLELSNRFGKEVIDLSEKYNDLPVFMSREAEYTPLQSENQIQMLVTLAEEYRALYIRLADRLHTMRTLRSLPLDNAECLKIAEEALYVYAPLAHRMGVMKVKGELEDLAFKLLHPQMFQNTRMTQIAANKAYHEAIEAVQLIMTNSTYLTSQGVTYISSCRIKDKYQLFLKMQRKNLSSVSQVRDALGMRIIAIYPRWDKETDESYKKRGNAICYSLVSKLRNVPGWVPAERGFKDYIFNSKDNGYQSLHQYIKNEATGTNVEIQVRTQAMHLSAEIGEAAHWFYKDQIYRPEIINTKVFKQAWRSSEQIAAKSPAELIGMAKKQLVSSRVLVFLEDRSTVLNMKKGQTALDAAFALHSDLGLTVSTVRVCGKEVELDYTLQNGDVVTCESTPGIFSVKPVWIDIARSSSAQSKIRKYFRDNNRSMLVCIGLMHFLMSLTLSEEHIVKKYPNGLPNVEKLAEFIKMRTPSNIDNFAGFLEQLGGASKVESASLLSGMLGISANKLTISTMGLGLIWARMIDKNGWEDKVMQKTLLLPILREVLPALDLPRVESMWIELIGARSLVIEESVGLLPLEHLLTSKLGPSGKVYNYVYPSVTQAPEHSKKWQPTQSFLFDLKPKKVVTVKLERTAVMERVRLYKAANSPSPLSFALKNENPPAPSLSLVEADEITFGEPRLITIDV